MRNSSRVPVERQLLGRSHRSRTITPRQCGPGRLVVGGVDPVVADVGIGEGDDLAGVGRVGDDLLVAGEHGVEHRFAGGHPALGPGRRWPRPRRRRRRPAPARPRPGARHRSGRSSPGLAVDDHRFAPEDGVADLTGQGPAAVGRVAAAAGQGGRVHRPGGRGIDDAEVGRTAGHDRPALVPAVGRVEPGDPAGCQLSRARRPAMGRSSSPRARESAVCRPSMPGGAWSKGRSLSSGGWGA